MAPTNIAPVGAPFVVNPTLTAIAIAYRNQRLIADMVFPRIPVGTELFRYMLFPMGGAFTVPNTYVSRKGRPNEVEVNSQDVEDRCQDYALDDPVPQKDIDNAPSNYDPLGRATERVSDLIELDREIRAAGMVFNTNNFAAANQTTLAGTSQWSDITDAVSNPLSDILNALDSCVIRPNIMIIGRAAFTKLIQHPKIVQAVFRNYAQAGVVRREDIAAVFELDQVLVGEGWLNTAKKGQAVTMARVWGKSCALVFQDKNADNQGGTTFGYTAQFKTREAGTIPDAKMGARGGQWVRVTETVKEVICASDLGYLIANAVA